MNEKDFMLAQAYSQLLICKATLLALEEILLDESQKQELTFRLKNHLRDLIAKTPDDLPIKELLKEKEQLIF